MSVMTSGIVIQMQASLRKLANDPQNREWMDKYIDNCIILEEIIEDLQKYRREGFVFTYPNIVKTGGKCYVEYNMYNL